MSRRRALGLLGTASFAGLSSVPASAKNGNGNGKGKRTQAMADINVLKNPNFITNAPGGAPPFDDGTPLFDPGPVSIPLNEIIEGSEEYDSVLSPSLNDGKHQIVKPPEGYDREAGYEDSWERITWGEYSAVGGQATVGEVKLDNQKGNGKAKGKDKANDNGKAKGKSKSGDTGTRVSISVNNGIPNGQYTIWVVKFAALSDDSDLGPSDSFVTPRGNALVGFHNLGQKFGDDDDSENDFTVDGDGKGDIHVFTEGGDLTGIPGFREPGYPFVGKADDYEQDEDRLSRIANDLREEDEIHFVGAYHYDDQTWGVYPGPWHVNHFSAVFAFDDS